MTLFGSPLVCHIGVATQKGGVCVHGVTGRGEGGIMMNPTPDTPTLTIYTTPNCPSCRLTRQALDRAGITYEVIDLSGRPDLVEQMRSEGLLQAPILDDGTSRRPTPAPTPTTRRVSPSSDSLRLLSRR